MGAVKPFLSKSVCFWSSPSTIKIKLVDKIKQSDNLSVILHVKHKKLTIILVFSWFLILGKDIKISKLGESNYIFYVITFAT